MIYKKFLIFLLISKLLSAKDISDYLAEFDFFLSKLNVAVISKSGLSKKTIVNTIEKLTADEIKKRGGLDKLMNATSDVQHNLIEDINKQIVKKLFEAKQS